MQRNKYIIFNDETYFLEILSEKKGY